MSASWYDDGAAVGRRIGQARRELGLTQAELATRIGVSLGTLDRYETGKADSSGKLVDIAEVTGRPVSWFTSTDYGVGGDGHEAELPAELGRRIAESIGQRGSAGRDLAEERIAAALGGPSSRLEVGDPSIRADDQPDLAETARDREERTALVQREKELQAALAEEQRKHGEAAAEGARLAEELERATARQQALSDALEQSRSELADTRAQTDGLERRVSEVETELRAAMERGAEATHRLGRAETELEHLRRQERSLAEELDLRQAELSVRTAELDAREAALDTREAALDTRKAELDAREASIGVRSAELDTRETVVAEAETGVEDRRRALGDVELRAAALERREEAAHLRESELEHRARALTELVGRLDELRNAAGAVESPRPVREDEHLAVVSGHGYRLVARWGAAPEPGDVVELDDSSYRCMRITASPFLGDDRLCAVLEPVTAAFEP